MHGCSLARQAAEALSAAVLSTAKEMEGRPAGDADFFKTLHSKVGSLEADMCGKFSFKESSPEYEAADWRYLFADVSVCLCQ